MQAEISKTHIRQELCASKQHPSATSTVPMEDGVHTDNVATSATSNHRVFFYTLTQSTHSHTHTHTHTHTLSLSLTHTHTHTPSLSLSLSHTHTHTVAAQLSARRNKGITK